MKMFRLVVMALVALGLCFAGVSTVAAQDSQPAPAADKPNKKKKKKKAVIKTPCKVAKHIAKKNGDEKFLGKLADWRAKTKAADKPKKKVKARITARKACRKYVRAHRKAKKGNGDEVSDEESDVADDAEAAELDEGEEEGEGE
jgi:hypothetical protein